MRSGRRGAAGLRLASAPSQAGKTSRVDDAAAGLIADLRDRAAGIPRLLSQKGIEVRLKHLAAGDYLLSPAVVVERKTTLANGHAASLARTQREVLEIIPGLGPALTRSLLNRFGSWQGGIAAGIGPARAGRVPEILRSEYRAVKRCCRRMIPVKFFLSSLATAGGKERSCSP